MCLLALCVFLWRIIYLGVLLTFWVVACFDIVKNHELFVKFEDKSSISHIICKYFLPILVCLSFSLLLCEVGPIYLFIYSLFWEMEKKEILPQFMSDSVLPMFSSKCFTLSGFTFRSLINFELILCMELKNYLFIYLFWYM